MGLFKKIAAALNRSGDKQGIEGRRAPRFPVKVIPGLSFRLTEPMKVFAVPMVNVSAVGIGIQYCNAFAQLNVGMDVAGVFEYKGQEISVKGKLVHKTFSVIGCELPISQELQQWVNDLVSNEARTLIPLASPAGAPQAQHYLRGEHRSEISLFSDAQGKIGHFEIVLLGNILRGGHKQPLIFQLQNGPPPDQSYTKVPLGTCELFAHFVRNAKGLDDTLRQQLLQYIKD